MGAETAVAVHAEHLEVAAHVRPADPARIAVTASDDRIDHNPITGPDCINVGPSLNHVAGELVADHPGVAGKRVGTVQNVDIGAADARSLHPQEHLTTRGLFWLSLRAYCQYAWR